MDCARFTAVLRSEARNPKSTPLFLTYRYAFHISPSSCWQVEGNLAAAGAKVYLFPDQGGAQVREIQLGGNFIGQHPPEAHFGLGDAERVERLLIQWPEKPAVYTAIENIEANQWIVVNHPERVKAGEPSWFPVPESAKLQSVTE